MTHFRLSLESEAAETSSERGTVLDLTAQVLGGCRSPFTLTGNNVICASCGAYLLYLTLLLLWGSPAGVPAF